MFNKLLIANRGEIACRILRTAHKMGIQVVAVYSDADRNAQHVLQADQAIYIGESPASASYLDINAVMNAVTTSGANALHPGYGFLAENAQLAQACEQAGCVFVGPSANAIEVMGSKIAAKRIVGSAGTPIVPGYEGDDQSADKLQLEAEKIGYPLLVKASSGGGGKGMRLVTEAGEFLNALASAKREALAAFGDDQVLLEKYLLNPKHIEIQILADNTGNTVALFERDCSVQRRHQKVVEEAPAPLVNAELREQMMRAAVTAAESVNYVGAGTIEFICDESGFYFMEMNTRLQVEHPVTEAITGLDLVEWQLRVATGEPLSFKQDDLHINGHAVEARIYAENPGNKFLPSTGKLQLVNFSERVRVDTGIVTGDEVSVHYDPMLAKLTAWGATRSAAIERLARALRESELVGVEHNIAYLVNVLEHEKFQDGSYTTGLADAEHEQLLPVRPQQHLIAAALWLCEGSGGEAWDNADGFRVNLPVRQRVVLKLGKEEYACYYDGTGVVIVNVDATGGGGEGSRVDAVAVSGNRITYSVKDKLIRARIVTEADNLYVVIAGDTLKLNHITLDQQSFDSDQGFGDRISSPMPGQVVNVLVREGDRIETGAPLLIIEAMKMEHSICAPKAGVVVTINCAAGARVEEDLELVIMNYDA